MYWTNMHSGMVYYTILYCTVLHICCFHVILNCGSYQVEQNCRLKVQSDLDLLSRVHCSGTFYSYS